MAEPIKQDTLGQVSTIGSRAIIGAVIGAVAVAAGGAWLGVALAGGVLGAQAAAVAGGIIGLYFGGVAGGMLGGATGALTGASKISADESMYYTKLRQQERGRQNVAGKAKDAGLQEGVALGYQQAMSDMQGQAQQIYQQGMQAGAQHVVEHIQQQQHSLMQQQMAAAETPGKSFVEKAGCKPCASKAEAVEAQKAQACNNHLAV